MSATTQARLTFASVLATMLASLTLIPLVRGKAWLVAVFVLVAVVAGVGAAVRQVTRSWLVVLLAGTGASGYDVEADLLAIPGVGPWTSAYVRLRALGDPDVLPATDLGIRHGARAAGLPEHRRALDEHARAWSPWRSYAAQHLWTPAPLTEETS